MCSISFSHRPVEACEDPFCLLIGWCPRSCQAHHIRDDKTTLPVVGLAGRLLGPCSPHPTARAHPYSRRAFRVKPFGR